MDPQAIGTIIALDNTPGSGLQLPLILLVLDVLLEAPSLKSYRPRFVLEMQVLKENLKACKPDADEDILGNTKVYVSLLALTIQRATAPTETPTTESINRVVEASEHLKKSHRTGILLSSLETDTQPLQDWNL